MPNGNFDTQVAIIGSGFGGSVAAWRFAQAGHKTLVIERGQWVTRETFEADLDATWNPKRHRFGMNELRRRGRHIIPWLGSAVGGGSHVYAATLKRRANFDGYPAVIQNDDMEAYFQKAEDMMDATPFPDWPPYSSVRATQLLFQAGKKLKEEYEDVEDFGPVNLGISFAPPEGVPGSKFINKHGAEQRYSDPGEQSLLGGDIDSKNTLDKNYLFLAQKAGAEIRPMTEADKIEPLPGGGYRIHCLVHLHSKNAWKRFLRKWMPFFGKLEVEEVSYTARRVVPSAGSIGSTELLLRNRDIHKTLSKLKGPVGQRYTTNGDFLSAIIPFRGIFVSWGGLLGTLLALIIQNYVILIISILAYFVGLFISRKPFDPDIGPTNSDFIRFKGEDGSTQGAFLEGGRYPTPGRLLIAIYLSVFKVFRPRHYKKIIRFTNFLRKYIPPFALIARTWPVPILKMGGDKAVGTFSLDKSGKATIDYDIEANRDFYTYLNRLAKRVAKASRSWWIPNFAFNLTKILEVPIIKTGYPWGKIPRSVSWIMPGGFLVTMV